MLINAIIANFEKLRLWLSRFYTEKIEHNSTLNYFFVVFLLLSLSGMLLWMNFKTPFVADDWCQILSARSYHTLRDYAAALRKFYFHWGGRIWGQGFILLFVSIPKPFFNVINTMGYILLILLLHLNVTGQWKLSASLILFLNFCIMAFLPAFGQDILWLSGCANYMWPMLLILSFLCLYRFYENQPFAAAEKPFFASATFALGLIAGWQNENVSVGLVLIVVAYLCLYKKRNGNAPLFAWTGLIGSMLGSAILWLAPGNFVRLQVMNSASEMVRRAPSFIRTVGHLIDDFRRNFACMFRADAVLFLFIMFALLMFFGKSRRKAVSAFFATGAMVCALAMTPIGAIGGRTFMSCIVFMLVAAGILFHDWQDSLKIRQVRAILMIMIFISTVELCHEAKNGIADYNKRLNENIRIIETQKMRGNFDVTINAVPPKNRFCAAYGLDDVKAADQNDFWINRSIAAYFGVHTVQSAKIRE